MKKFHYLRFSLFLMIVAMNVNCTKDPSLASGGGVVVPPPPAINTAPIVNAGLDAQVLFPFTTCKLNGSAVDKENNIKHSEWRKISGPGSYMLDDSNSLSTYARNLIPGIYEFELKVDDSGGLAGRDTVTIAVNPLFSTTNEIIFNNLAWGNQGLYGTLLWGSAILISNIEQYFPAANGFRIYMKKQGDANWTELFIGDYGVINVSYINSTLIIWSTYDETVPISIKLAY